MSLRLFVGYFVVLSTCATIAFASSISAKPYTQQAATATASVHGKRPVPCLRHHSLPMKATLLACAQ